MTFATESIQKLYNFQSNYHVVNGFRLHCVDEGTGPPVVMVHGNPTWSFMFRELASGLKKNHRIVVPDHIGCGLSEKPSEGEYSYRLEQRIQDLESLLNSIGVTDNLNLIVHDWGGLIGFGFAVRNPDRVRRLVVLNTAAFEVPLGHKLHWSIRLCRRSRLASWLILHHNLFPRVASRIGCRTRLSPEIRDALMGPYDSPENRIAVLRFIQDIPLESSHPTYPLVESIQNRLDRLKDRPMLIAWGMRDFVFDRGFLEEWMRRFPRAEVCRFPEAGHYVLEDAGAEITSVVRDFLAESGQP